jgi:LacI family transcriptional regulator/LacI family repressor for deo operon, udp, cdd, tsx, nupC, and nupG
VLDTRHTDGVIILGDYKDDELAIREILEGRRAVVAMCRGEARAGAITVNTDNRAGMRALLDHLTGLGHTRLAFIEGDWMGDFKERRKAYIDYLQEKGFELNPDWIPQDTDDSSGGYQAMHRLIALKDRPTAILAADDIIAIGALKAAQEAGLQIPGQVSLTGFDGIEMTQFISPALTTVRQPIEVMSQIALKRLMDLIAGKEVNEEVSIRVQPELIVRQSTGSVSRELEVA